MGFWGGLAKVGKFAAPIAAGMIGGPAAGMAVKAGISALDSRGKKQPQQPGRGVAPSGNIFQQRFPQMMQGASQQAMGGGGMAMGRGASPQMNMDDYISAGRNTQNPNWMMPAFNPNQPHPLSRMPPYGNAPMRPMPRMQMQGGRPQY